MVQKVQEKTTKLIKIKLRRHERDEPKLVRRAHQETEEEEEEEEREETLQHRPRKHETELYGEGSGPRKDNIPIPR